MFLTNLFCLNKKCHHEKVAPNIEFGYCPDCGKAIRNEWYITRCACCGLKLVTIEHDNIVTPQNKFCTNCGSQDYIVEKLENINIININYAVLIREEVEHEAGIQTTTQCWQEKTSVQPKLLTQYR